ncbi:MAG TPA: gluconate 2-dehydrogenase subunit 3 family protein, partial [Acidimicrobiales bacterium]|nr:gluconate 2-dehydrogenase subunit 3 family protein [Acidimicrobiales bacterium]
WVLVRCGDSAVASGGTRMPVWFTEHEYRVAAAACDRLIPGGDTPGATAAGAVDYLDVLLGAFSFDPPRIWAGGPTSGRAGGDAAFGRFHRLGPLDELAWRTRIEGSRGLPEREFNGPVVGWQERYRAGLAALGGDFCDLEGEAQDERLQDPAHEEFVALLYEHCCEGVYGAPEYGGNRDGIAWASIRYPGDVQPRGWSDDEVTGA